MTTKSDAYEKLAEAVSALEELGLEIEKAEVTATTNGPQQMIAHLMGEDEPEDNLFLEIVASMEDDGEKQEKPDDSRDDGERIEIDGTDGEQADNDEWDPNETTSSEAMQR